MARGLAHAVAFGLLLQLAAAFRTVPSLSRPARAVVLRVPIVSADAATTAEAAAAAVADGGLLNEILTGKPFEIQYMEVFDPSLGTLQQPSGVAITPSGWAGLVFIALFQLLSPAGIVQYSKRLRDDEQAWLDEGKCKTSFSRPRAFAWQVLALATSHSPCVRCHVCVRVCVCVCVCVRATAPEQAVTNALQNVRPPSRESRSEGEEPGAREVDAP